MTIHPLAALLAAMLLGLVNPGLQPRDLCQRYGTVVVLRVESVDGAQRTAELSVRSRVKGEFAPGRVTVRGEAELDDVFGVLLTPGQTVVAFTGAPRDGDKVLFYLEQGSWGVGTRGADGWTWTTHLDAASPDSLFGTFNGRADRLAELVADVQAGCDYFPPHPSARFAADRPIGQLTDAVGCLALIDLDGDGDLDVYAGSSGGDRILLQRGPLAFVDATGDLGLDGLASRSVGVADIDGDGRADLLAGAVLLRQGADGRFARAAVQPDLDAARLRCAVFAEIDGDGRPDILASFAGGGLRVLCNVGDGAFTDTSEALGLRADACVPDGDGAVCWGDVDGDGRADLHYAAGGGRLLVRDATGRFQPAGRDGGFDFADAGGSPVAGGGTVAALWRADRLGVGATTDGEVLLLAYEDGRVLDATGFANEITEGVPAMRATLAEDLDADGLVDLYTVSADGEGILHQNRGHGSFMAPHKYSEGIWQGPAHANAACAVAGDLDGDGAADLVLGGRDGQVTLLRNEVLVVRAGIEAPRHHERLQQQARHLAVALSGPGTVGAEVRLADDGGRVVARRLIGGIVGAGGRGPDATVISVLQPGRYRLAVRFADGREREQAVDLTAPGVHRLAFPADHR